MQVKYFIYLNIIRPYVFQEIKCCVVVDVFVCVYGCRERERYSW